MTRVQVVNILFMPPGPVVLFDQKAQKDVLPQPIYRCCLEIGLG